MTRSSDDPQQDINFVHILELMGIPKESSPIASLQEADSAYGEGEPLITLVNLFCSDQPEDIAKIRDYMIYNIYSQDAGLMPTIYPENQVYNAMWSATDALKYHMYKVCAESFGLQNIHKEECSRIMEEMRQLFAERISGLDWMSDYTKQNAIQKLEAMKFNIGYPDQWNEKFTPEVEGDNIFDAVAHLRCFQRDCTLSLIGKQATEYGWEYLASVTPFYLNNAFYQPSCNMLVILPTFLTEARFSTEETEAKQYATSIVFGHEMSHGFDSNGSKYDAIGAETDWWAPEDAEKFAEKQLQLIDLYSTLEFYEGQEVGYAAWWLGENMADYGGTTLAIENYKRRLRQQGYSQAGIDEQLKKFFLSYAQIWKSTKILSPEGLQEHYDSQEEHADDHIRINGIVRLMDDWYRVYNIMPGDKLYVAPEDRVRIW